MTPTQLRAFAAVVRLGSVKGAASELGVTESAVSLLVAQLRKELDDPLFTRTASGLAFTPGGLRLASRAAEILGLQDQTVREVSQAGQGRRLLRVAASALFAEHAAPGLIELFANRAKDLDVELSVRRSAQFASLLVSRAIDLAIGPAPTTVSEAITCTPFLNYELVAVVAPEHPLAAEAAGHAALREQTWFLGPAAAAEDGSVASILRQVGVPEHRQRIFQSDAAALDEAKRGNGVALSAQFVVARDVHRGQLVRLRGGTLQRHGTWAALALPPGHRVAAADELLRFITTPRALQAMLRGAGVEIGHFRPSVHVTLWS